MPILRSLCYLLIFLEKFGKKGHGDRAFITVRGRPNALPLGGCRSGFTVRFWRSFFEPSFYIPGLLADPWRYGGGASRPLRGVPHPNFRTERPLGSTRCPKRSCGTAAGRLSAAAE